MKIITTTRNGITGRYAVTPHGVLPICLAGLLRSGNALTTKEKTK